MLRSQFSLAEVTAGPPGLAARSRLRDGLPRSFRIGVADVLAQNVVAAAIIVGAFI